MVLVGCGAGLHLLVDGGLGCLCPWIMETLTVVLLGG